MAASPYRVEDRSILLPYYRRYLVEPCLRFIPASIHPNTITHAAHAAKLAATVLVLTADRDRGGAYLAAAAGVQLYVWCDNVDGAHARRTGQTSSLGELLDHGLDQVTSVYGALLTAAALGAPPLATVALAAAVPGATALIYWEQASTGTLRLGRLNQVESIGLLSVTLLVAGLFGASVWARVPLGPFTVRDVLVACPLCVIAVGAGRGLARVASQRGALALAPAAAFVALAAAIVLGAAGGWLPAPFAIALASALSVHFGVRMLRRRIEGRAPGLDPLLGTSAALAALAALALAAGLASKDGARAWAPALAVAESAVFVLAALHDARRAVRLVRPRAPR